MPEYLERETLLATIENRKRFLNSGIARRNLRQADIFEVIKTLPAADVAPVVHGRWRKYSSDEWICTHCGYYKYCDTLDGGVLPPFCEECGVRMDGE